MRRNLVVDIGNSRVKCAVMEQGSVLEEWNVASFEQIPLCSIVEKYAPTRSIVASTRGDGAAVQAILERAVGESLHFGAEVAMPITIDYSTPQTLGADRVAAAVGVMDMAKGRNALIIDCGTAITIDLLSSDSAFCGGFISAGLSLR